MLVTVRIDAKSDDQVNHDVVIYGGHTSTARIEVGCQTLEVDEVEAKLLAHALRTWARDA